MKYIKYVAILAFALFRKVFGLVWIYVALPFRQYARNTVYNYALSNGIYLKRLLERPIYESEEYEDIKPYYAIMPYHGTEGGFIHKRKVSAIEYYVVVWLIWGWLDDDSNYDTYDCGFINTIRNGERLNWFPKKWLDGCKCEQYGNSFDLGDARLKEFSFWGTTLWNIRNTAYNFKYLHYEVRESEYAEKCFYVQKWGWEFGYVPYGIGDERAGRLVFQPIRA